MRIWFVDHHLTMPTLPATAIVPVTYALRRLSMFIYSRDREPHDARRPARVDRDRDELDIALLLDTCSRS